jgi:hypothetical protein
MSEPDLKTAIEAIAPTSKAAKLRQLMPVIERKLDEGVKAVDILAVLKEGGLEMTLGTFRNYLHQYRKKKQGAVDERSGDVTTLSRPQPTPPSSEPDQEDRLRDKKQRRENRADQFIRSEFTNPLLKRIKEKNK